MKPDYDPGEKTFGMAKWRASQKARRKQGNLKLESQADSKPYHFDDPSEYDIGGTTLEYIIWSLADKH